VRDAREINIILEIINLCVKILLEKFFLRRDDKNLKKFNAEISVDWTAIIIYFLDEVTVKIYGKETRMG